MKMGERLKVEVLKTSGQPGGRTGILIRQSSLLPGSHLSHSTRSWALSLLLLLVLQANY